jgi:adenosylmethionine-8-amino-7-oxononanoate aminotransferase
MAGIEFVADRETRAPFETTDKVAVRVREAGLRNGVVLYPGTGMADGRRGDIISLYPPLTVTLDDIADMGERIRATLTDVGHELGAR